MTTYEIQAGDVVMGSYEAESEEAAKLVYLRDAGYKTVAAAAEVLGQTEDEVLSDIRVRAL